MSLVKITSEGITDGSIVNADLHSAANIASSKLADSGVSAGSYGSATAIPAITLNAKGIVTSVSTNSVNTTTNLGISTSTTAVTVTSSTGDNAAISEASGSAAGVMSVAHHDKLDGIEASATADQTASEILTALLTVDGISSGIVATSAGAVDVGGVSTNSALQIVFSTNGDGSGRSIACSSGSDDFTYNPNSKALVVEGAITGASLNGGAITGTGLLKIANTFPQIKLEDTDTARHFSIINANGTFRINDDTSSAARLEIDSSGTIDISGTVDINANTLRGDDNAKILLGSGSGGDLRLTHDGSDSYIQAYGAGGLELQAQVANEHVIVRAPSGGDFRAYVNGGSTLALICNASGQNVEMRYGGNKKAETVSGGFTVTGTCTATAFSGDGSNLSNLPSSSDNTKLPLSGGELTGNLITHQVRPDGNGNRELGTSSYRWQNIYTSDIDLSNEGSSNDVDGTWGSYTIQEGAESLFLINKRNGKKYKFNLTEVS